MLSSTCQVQALSECLCQAYYGRLPRVTDWLLISPHLSSIIVENWLSRGGLRQKSVMIRRRRSHPLLKQPLPEFPPLILARPVLQRAHEYFTFILMCVIGKMLFQLWSISANCLKCLHRFQHLLVEVPETRLSYSRTACMLQGTVHYLNLLLAFCEKNHKNIVIDN